MPLFRPEVFAARKDRLHGEVSLFVPISWQLIGVVLGFSLVVAAIFLFSASYSQVETLRGAVVVDQGTASITAARSGIVSSVNVHEGEHVDKGQVLTLVRSEDDLPTGGSASGLALSSLKKQDEQLSDQQNSIMAAALAQKAGLLSSNVGAQQQVASLESQIEDQKRLLTIAQSQLDDAQSVYGKGFLSRRDFEAREAARITARQQLAQLKSAAQQKQSEIAQIARTISQTIATAQSQVAAIQAQRTALAQQAAQFNSAQGYAVHSPFRGTITALTARPGQFVTQGDSLMIVMPASGRQRIELYVPTNSVGFLQPGQHIRLAIDAFPFEQFGTVSATMSEISSTPILKQTAQGPISVYLATAELSEPFVRAFGQRQPLRAGMTLSARVTTRRQSLFEWLFQPIFAVHRR